MNYKLGFLTCLPLILCACTTPKPPQGYDLSPTQETLAESSYSISHSVAELAETAQAAHPSPNLAAPPSPASYGMGGVTSIDWSGPIEPLLREMAKASDYRVRVLGTSPAIPVIVTLYEKNAMLGDILRNAGYQCGRRASVVVFPESRVIELRYAKN
jgi:defect-in-organelle-trafficking protein DotD